jgi:hypothetical protein
LTPRPESLKTCAPAGAAGQIERLEEEKELTRENP